MIDRHVGLRSRSSRWMPWSGADSSSSPNGTGVLAGELAPHSARVIGIDADESMAAAASARLGDDPRVSTMRCRFDEFAAAAGEGEADLITMVAVLHVVDLLSSVAA